MSRILVDFVCLLLFFERNLLRVPDGFAVPDGDPVPDGARVPDGDPDADHDGARIPDGDLV